jgi:capsular polysaccharide biosynthesis protein/Mrp family chromosome partitioning ATPase
MTFGDYVAVVRRRAGWIITSVVVCVLLSLAYSHHQAKKYQASSSVVITNVAPPAFLGGSGSSSSTTIDRQVATDATIADSAPVAELAVQQAGMAQDLNGKELLAASSVVPDTSANVLHFTVTAGGSDNAVTLANGYATAYLKYQNEQITNSTKGIITALNNQIAQLQTTPSQGARLASAKANLDALTTYISAVKGQTTRANATLATDAKKTQPKTSRNVLLAAAFGLAIGLILAFIIQAADDRVYSVRQFARLSLLPIIGKLPPMRSRLRNRPIREAPEPLKEQARTVAARLGFARNARHASTLLITSADPIIGSADVASWMAWGLAEVGNRVVLINMDIDHPDDPAPLLELSGINGMSDEGSTVAPNVSGGGSLVVATPGPSVAPHSPEMHLLVQRARDEADVVLINAPAITSSSAAVVLTELADAVVPIARLPRTRRGDIARLLDALGGIPTATLGAIVVGGEDYAEPESAPAVSHQERPRADSAHGAQLEQWAGDVISQRR